MSNPVVRYWWVARHRPRNMQALKRIGKPDDIADVVAFLSSNGSRWITGTTIHVHDGSKL
jgi:3-oxoacyl-[acyl-carrier protein] reductase